MTTGILDGPACSRVIARRGIGIDPPAASGRESEHLVISRATAKTHVSRALLKLHARDRAQQVTLAYETGLVLPRQPTVAGFNPPGAALLAA